MTFLRLAKSHSMESQHYWRAFSVFSDTIILLYLGDILIIFF